MLVLYRAAGLYTAFDGDLDFIGSSRRALLDPLSSLLCSAIDGKGCSCRLCDADHPRTTGILTEPPNAEENSENIMS